MSEIITATVATDDIVVNVNETLLYKGDKGDKGDTGSIENLELGGRNLAINTNSGDSNWSFGSNNGNIIKSSKFFTELGNVSGVRFDIDENPTGWSFLAYSSDNVKNVVERSQGRKFSLSLDIKSDVSSFITMQISNADGTGKMIDFGSKDIKSNEWNHIEVTATVAQPTAENQVIYIYTETIFKNAKYIEIANLKLERGEVATDWTPAPEDYETKFNNIIARLEALESK